MKLLTCLGLFISLSVYSVTYEDFSKFSNEEKIEYFDYNDSQIVYSQSLKKISRQNVTPEIFSFIENDFLAALESLKTYESEFDTEVHNYHYAIVGMMDEEVEFFFSEDNKFLGGRINYFQRGCSHEDEVEEMTYYYESYEEAHLDNCFDNDVSWSGDTTFDENLIELTNSDYMEWTGH